MHSRIITVIAATSPSQIYHSRSVPNSTRFDLLWICRTACRVALCSTNLQQIEVWATTGTQQIESLQQIRNKLYCCTASCSFLVRTKTKTLIFFCSRGASRPWPWCARNTQQIEVVEFGRQWSIVQHQRPSICVCDYCSSFVDTTQQSPRHRHASLAGSCSRICFHSVGLHNERAAFL